MKNPEHMVEWVLLKKVHNHKLVNNQDFELLPIHNYNDLSFYILKWQK